MVLDEKIFDYIFLGNLLEHLYDPWTVLYEYKKFLKDDGFIIAIIHNIRSLEILKTSGRWGLDICEYWNYEC